MPELPEVETVRRALPQPSSVPVLATSSYVSRGCAGCVAADFAERLRGRRIERVERRSKYLLLRLAGATH